MLTHSEKRLTYADVLAWEDNRRFELYDGRPVALASPSVSHQRISMALSAQLYQSLLGKRCEVMTAPLDVCLFARKSDAPLDIDTVVQPDIMVACDPEKIKGARFQGAPDLVMEILSPASLRYDRLVKFALYQQAGVREYWIVDPETRTVSVHTLEEGRYGSPVVYTSGAVVPVGILDDCKVELKTVFPGMTEVGNGEE